MIPLVNLEAQYESIKNEIHAAIDDVLKSQNFINSKRVRQFEKEMAQAHGAAHAIGCSNGTSAIFLALEALGIGPQDEVITVPYTFIATAEGISHVGAKPVFVDINPDTYQMDVTKIEALITKKTKAIMPVHLYGNATDMKAVMKIAQKHGLKVIEDCAQSHLAKLDGKHLGTFGDGATFSFYPGKNLGAYGDAGMVFMKDESNALRVRKMLDHGRLSKYEHDIVGYNHRMDELQAAVLSVKIKFLKEWTKKRQAVARLYDRAFEGFKVITPTVNSECVYHLYVVEVSNRDVVMDGLKKKDIASGVHYPLPLHLQPAYAHLGYKKGDFPVSENASARVMSLPICPELDEEDVSFVIKTFLESAVK